MIYINTIKTGENIEQIIRSHGFSKYQFAKEMGVSIQTVMAWCDGRSLPRLERLMEICKMADKKVEEVVAYGRA